MLRRSPTVPHEGTFLAGVIAALKTETQQIGFIGGMKVPLVEAFEIGFGAGIQATNPDIEFVADYVGVTPQAFNDPAKAKELALAQYNRGIDIILAAAGVQVAWVSLKLRKRKKNQLYGSILTATILPPV